MSKVYRCLYCDKTCTLEEEKGKYFMKCSSCGKRELTKMGKARLEAREIK